MADARITNPLVEQFRRGGVPRDVRFMAAQGLLPLTPDDLAEMWTDLLRDPDQAIRGAAETSLKGMPVEELLPVVQKRDTPAPVLSWAVVGRPERALREVVLQNPSLPDETIEMIAGSLSEELAELVVINQARLLRRTTLLVALEGNSSLNNDQRRRLRELRETFRIGEAPEPAPAQPATAEAAAPAPEPAAPEPVAEEPPAPEPVLSEEEAVARYLSPEEQQQAEKVSAVQKIYRMNTAEKLIAALKGTREERTILVRDPNRLVSTAVLGSPRLTEAEIESFSAMKNLSSEILRHIGNHREWSKKYPVLSNLVKNPRTPIGVALNFVPRLNPRDLKALAVDRNVPEAVRKHAQKFTKGNK
jgi:hypothetical protein